MQTISKYEFIKLLAEERGVSAEVMIGQAIGLIDIKLSAPGADNKVAAQWAAMNIRQKADLAIRIIINRYNHQ